MCLNTNLKHKNENEELILPNLYRQVPSLGTDYFLYTSDVRLEDMNQNFREQTTETKWEIPNSRELDFCILLGLQNLCVLLLEIADFPVLFFKDLPSEIQARYRTESDRTKIIEYLESCNSQQVDLELEWPDEQILEGDLSNGCIFKNVSVFSLLNLFQIRHEYLYNCALHLGDSNFAEDEKEVLKSIPYLPYFLPFAFCNTNLVPIPSKNGNSKKGLPEFIDLHLLENNSGQKSYLHRDLSLVEFYTMTELLLEKSKTPMSFTIAKSDQEMFITRNKN